MKCQVASCGSPSLGHSRLPFPAHVQCDNLVRRGIHGRRHSRLRALGSASVDDILESYKERAFKDIDSRFDQIIADQEETPQSFDWFNNWYPVAFVSDLDPSQPHRFVLLGSPLVIWYDKNVGEWQAFKDVCPHRLVPLSEGRVNPQGQLECGYHGWSFSSTGRCEVLPQGGNRSNPRTCATVFPSTVKQGLLFVKPIPLPRPQPDFSHAGLNGSSRSSDEVALLEDDYDVPVVQELNQSGWVSQDTWRDVPYDWSTLMENVLDSSHVPFTHHASISNRKTVGDYDIKLRGPMNKRGFQGEWFTGPRAGQLGPQSSWYRAPCYMQHKIDARRSKGWESMVIVYAVPTTPGHCRLFNRNLFKFYNNQFPARIMRLVPAWAVHLGTHVALEDDQIFLHMGEVEYVQQRASGKTASQAYYMPSQADTLVVAFRNWLEKFGGGGPWGRIDTQYLNKLEPRQSRTQLLDRYSQHTVNCHSCQKGLRLVERMRLVAGLGWRVLGSMALLGVAMSLVLAAMGMDSATSHQAVAIALSNANAQVDPTSAVVPASMSGVLKAMWSGLGWHQVVGAGAGLAADMATSSPAQAQAGGNMLVATGLASALMVLADAVTGLQRALTLGTAALVLGLADWALGSVERRFYTGDYPPKRNLDKN